MVTTLRHEKIKYIATDQNKHLLGLYYPAKKRNLLINNKPHENVQWPDIMIEYPTMRLMHRDPQKPSVWNRLDIPNNTRNGLCLGNMYLDFNITNVETAWFHVEGQFFNSNWTTHSKLDPTFESYFTDIVEIDFNQL